MEALSGGEFKRWLRAYHDRNPGAKFPSLSLLVDADAKTTYDRLVETAAGAARGLREPVILDVGCGDGMLLALIGSRLPSARLMGVDQSPAELDIARSTLEPFESDLFEADFAHLPLAAGSVDIALSHMALMLAGDVEPALAACRRALRAGGTLAFIVGTVGEPSGVLAGVRAAAAELLASEGTPPPALDRRMTSVDGISGLPWPSLGFGQAAVETIDLSRRITIEQLVAYAGERYDALMLSTGGRELLERAVRDLAWREAGENATVEVRNRVALCRAVAA